MQQLHVIVARFYPLSCGISQETTCPFETQLMEVNMLTVHERRAEITALASNQGHASVAELAERFSVTPETIRRDLKYLESSGLVHRVHGGAVTNHTLRSDEQPFWVPKSHILRKRRLSRKRQCLLFQHNQAAS